MSESNDAELERLKSQCQAIADGSVVDLLGSRYAISILYVLGEHEPIRYSDIEEIVPGVSTATLSTRLQESVDAGLVSREEFDEIPPRVEYSLTDRGSELVARLAPVVEWAVEQPSH